MVFEFYSAQCHSVTTIITITSFLQLRATHTTHATTNKQTQLISYDKAYSCPKTSFSNSTCRMLLLLLFRLSIVTLVANAEETFIPVLDFSYDLVSDAGSHASLDLEALADDIPPSFTVCTAVMIKSWT